MNVVRVGNRSREALTSVDQRLLEVSSSRAAAGFYKTSRIDPEVSIIVAFASCSRVSIRPRNVEITLNPGLLSRGTILDE